jgi:hypothetical protein
MILAMVTDVNTGAKSLVTVEVVGSQGVDPGFGIPGLGGGNYPSGGPVRPGRPTDPGYGRPGFIQGRPDQDLPWGPGRPDNTLPPLPPDPNRPGNPIVLPPEISNGLPVHPLVPGNELPGVPPGVIWPPLPPSVPQGKAIALVAISGVGYRWTVIDTSLSAGWPEPPPTAGQPLPPAPAPK